MIAVIIGTPMPAMIARRADRAGADADLHRVDAQRRSAPRSPSAVATLPATRSTSGNALAHARAPCRARPASGRARCRRPARRRWRRPAPSARSIVSRATPTAAPQRSRPSESFDAFGYLTAFWMSLTVISPFSRKSRSTTSSFSTLCWCRISRAASSVVPTGTVNSVLARHHLGDRRG